jgi:hypothetical protein
VENQLFRKSSQIEQVALRQQYQGYATQNMTQHNNMKNMRNSPIDQQAGNSSQGKYIKKIITYIEPSNNLQYQPNET